MRGPDAEEIARLAARGLAPDTDPVAVLGGPPGRPLLRVRLRPPAAPATPATPATPGAAPPMRLDPRSGTGPPSGPRALALGAMAVREAEGHSVLGDPEGHPFCPVGPG